MSVLDVIRLRKSVRSYLDRPVEEDELAQVLEAARLAPSASNRQEWRFVVVTDPSVRNALADAASGQRFVAQAPVVIACCADTDNHIMACGEPCYPIDVAIAVDHMTLVAAELGLGTCWIGAFRQEPVRQLLGIPQNIRIVELLTLGYPADPSQVRKKRLSIDDFVHRESWGRGL
ncbi:MAG: nitroreductase family protein [Planctomycetes bacterium]|nr:nitroreductase family protein [Planctomycetota bacterium]